MRISRTSFTASWPGVISLVGWLALAGCERAQGLAPVLAPPGASPQAAWTPPSLEELRSMKWIAQRVEEPLAVLARRLAAAGAPVPDAEGLSINNDGPQANRKILSAIGRLPASDLEVDWDATLNLFLFARPNTLHAFFGRSTYETMLNMCLHAGPFGIDHGLTHQGAREVESFLPMGSAEVVSEWSTSEDRLIDKVVLRDDLTWSDGQPFDARDIEFSFGLLRNPDVGSQFGMIVESLKAVKAYDDRTVVYFHREPLVTNPWDINFPIIPRHVYESTWKADPTLQKSEEHLRLARQPVTSGPYRLASMNPGQEYVLERRDEWYEKGGKRIRAKPFAKRIRFRVIQDRTAAFLAYRKGELDEVELSPDQWQDPTVTAQLATLGARVKGDEWTYSFIAWNQGPESGAPYLRDPRVREALSLAFPHQELLEKVFGGLYAPARGIFHPDSWMADPEAKPLRQDLPRSARLLEEAGWTDTDGDTIRDREVDGKRVPLRFSLLIASGSPVATRVASLFRKSLETLGVACDTQELDGGTLLDRCRKHQFQSVAFVWGPGADPDTSRTVWTTQASHSEAGSNFISYSNPQVDRLFEQGRREFDPEKRAAIYHEIQRLISADHALTFLYIRASFFAVSRDLRGFNYSPRGPFSYTPGILSLWKRRPEGPAPAPIKPEEPR